MLGALFPIARAVRRERVSRFNEARRIGRVRKRKESRLLKRELSEERKQISAMRVALVQKEKLRRRIAERNI